MTSCTILISITHELVFLKKSIELIRRYKHSYIEQDIIIADQSEEDMSSIIENLYGSDNDITIIKLPRVDVGWSMDESCKIAKGEYFCSLDGDAFPIHKNWLYVPIKLIEKYNLSFVGKDTGLSNSYKDLGNFTCINNYFRVSKTSLMRKISEDVGFIRIQNWNKVGYSPKVEVSIGRNVDSAVISQWYSNQIGGDKVSLTINKYLGLTKTQGIFGMIIDDLVFHMVLWRKMEDEEHSKLNKLDNFGESYLYWYDRINKEGFTDDIIDEMLNKSINHERSRNINDLVLQDNDEITLYIEELKNS
jgi:hypothetical protein